MFILCAAQQSNTQTGFEKVSLHIKYNKFPYSHHPHSCMSSSSCGFQFCISFAFVLFGGETSPPLHCFNVQQAFAVILSRIMKRPVTPAERRYCGGLFHSETIGCITGHDKKKNSTKRVYTGWNHLPLRACLCLSNVPAKP